MSDILGKTATDCPESIQKISAELQKKQDALDEAKKLIERDREKMERLVNLKTDFISAVSHELRTPLTSIKESIALIQDGSAGSLSDNQKKFLTIAKNNIDRLSRLINNMLDFSKIEEGQLKLLRKVCPVEQLVSDVARTLNLEITKKKINFQADIQPGMPAVYLDPDRITQVLLNLTGNALKFTPPGGSITVSVRTVTDFPGLSEMIDQFPNGQKFIHFTVADTGPGIKEEDRERLFQKFQQLEGGIARAYGGVGLGLVISKGFVESHGGRIWVESKYKEGSRFQFVIPVTSPPKILVVDDDKNIVESIAFVLESKNYLVLRAYDGREALDVLKNDIPNLIVMDIMMPRMNGYDLIRELKQNEASRAVPILILSGYTVDTGLLKNFGLNLIHSIAKPFDIDELMGVLETMLREGK